MDEAQAKVDAAKNTVKNDEAKAEKAKADVDVAQKEVDRAIEREAAKKAEAPKTPAQP